MRNFLCTFLVTKKSTYLCFRQCSRNLESSTAVSIRIFGIRTPYFSAFLRNSMITSSPSMRGIWQSRIISLKSRVFTHLSSTAYPSSTKKRSASLIFASVIRSCLRVSRQIIQSSATSIFLLSLFGVLVWVIFRSDWLNSLNVKTISVPYGPLRFSSAREDFSLELSIQILLSSCSNTLLQMLSPKPVPFGLSLLPRSRIVNGLNSLF